MRKSLAAGLLLFAAAATALDTGDNEVSQADLARAQARVAEVQKQLGTAQGALSRGQQRLRQAEQEAGRIAAALRQVKLRERELTRALKRVQDERNTLLAGISRQQQALARDARQAWLLGREQQLRLWLNADDPQAVARVSRYYEYLQRDRAQRLESYRSSRAQLATVETRMQAEQAQLDEARLDLATREQALAQTREERRSAVGELAAEVKSRKGDLARSQADAAALKRLFAEAREAWRNVPPPRSARPAATPRRGTAPDVARQDEGPALASRAAPGATGQPLKQRRGQLRWPVSGRLAARFGSPIEEGKLRLNGIVIAAGEGSEVRAVHAGRVVFADWLRGYGQLLLLDHGDGLLSAYGYNQSLLRAVGDWVEEGEGVATVGASGGRASPALYFELRQGGEPQDPARWLRR